MFQKRRNKYGVLILIMFLAGVLLSGCGLGEKLDDWKSGSTDDTAAPTLINTGQIILDQPLVIDATESPVVNNNPLVDMVQVSLYFANDNGKLVRETRKIPKETGIARATINELIIGPEDESLLSTLPAGTVLKDINIKDGVCIVDFSSEFQKGITSASEESLCLHSLSNTLAQFDSVTQVKILVNGKNVDKFTGAIDVSVNIIPDESLISR